MPYARAFYDNDEETQKRALAAGVLTETEGFTKPILFTASTEGKKRDGHNLRSEDWSMERYDTYPIILWGHDMRGENLPIGRGQPWMDGNVLRMAVSYDEADPFAMRVHDKAKKHMVGGSVQWDEVDGKNQLVEFSMVPVPLDPDSLPMQQARAFRSLQHQLNQTIGFDDDAISIPLSADDPLSTIRSAAQAAMVGVFHADQLDPKKRKKLFVNLERVYNVLQMTPPSWREPSELSVLSAASRRGLFFEDEGDMLLGLFEYQQRSAELFVDPYAEALRMLSAEVGS